MEQGLMCPICHERVFSETGKGCKMCGMVLEDKNRLFCSGECEEIYGMVHDNRGL